jgi:signal transduction histidine kinase
LKKELDFDINYNISSEFIHIDPIKFSQILQNLLSNAIKFTDKGEILLKISENEENWKFEVIDTGIGISENNIESVFKGFRKDDSPFVKSSLGKGLGLALTKRLVQLHQGRIGVKSKLGEGSNFFFTIPKKLVTL